MELKTATTDLERYALANHYTVELPGAGSIRISPLELQIAYKLWLGSDKDLGDALFLYRLFRDFLDEGELGRWCSALGVDPCRLRST